MNPPHNYKNLIYIRLNSSTIQGVDTNRLQDNIQRYYLLKSWLSSS